MSPPSSRETAGTGWFSWHGARLTLRLKVVPRGGRDEIVGLLGDRLKVRVSAAPSAGAANRRLVSFLAREFGVARSSVSIEAGAAAREKRVVVESPKRRPAWLPS